MAKFVYKNTQNKSPSHMPFKLYRGYHTHMSLKKKTDSFSCLKTIDNLKTELQELLVFCRKNLNHAQEL